MVMAGNSDIMDQIKRDLLGIMMKASLEQDVMKRKAKLQRMVIRCKEENGLEKLDVRVQMVPTDNNSEPMHIKVAPDKKTVFIMAPLTDDILFIYDDDELDEIIKKLFTTILAMIKKGDIII